MYLRNITRGNSYSKRLIVVLIFLYMALVNCNYDNSKKLSMDGDSQINFYYIPLLGDQAKLGDDIVINYNNNCVHMVNSDGAYGNCTCKISKNNQSCSYTFNSVNILPYISFKKPYQILGDQIKYDYYINSGINNFKISTDPNHCMYKIPIVNYYYIPDSELTIVQITNLD
jgi:hypothetical protein